MKFWKSFKYSSESKTLKSWVSFFLKVSSHLIEWKISFFLKHFLPPLSRLITIPKGLYKKKKKMERRRRRRRRRSAHEIFYSSSDIFSNELRLKETESPQWWSFSLLSSRFFFLLFTLSSFFKKWEQGTF